MFSFSDSPVDVPSNLRGLLVDTWEWVGRPATWWTGQERVAIARVARASRRGEESIDPDLPPAANDAAGTLASTPAVTTREWVDGIVEAIELERYIELTGLTASVVAIDTISRLLGSELEPLPDALPGEPTREPLPPSLNKGKAWVMMGRPPIPPTVLAAVPDTSRRINQLHDQLYMAGEQMGDPDITLSDLHRTQIELVAATTSLGNDCFF